MPAIFISYTKQDQKFADFLYNHLTNEGLSVFQSGLSLKPGQKWDRVILQNLKDSACVLFLASKAACQSSYVQQEIGASIITNKNLIPVVWDMLPEELPGWAKNFQALNLAEVSLEHIQETMSDIAAKLKMDNWVGLLLLGLLIAGLVYLCLRK